MILLSSRRAAARARDRLDLAERLCDQKRITAVQLLAAQARAEVAKHHAWPMISARVVGTRIALTWKGDFNAPETEKILLHFWRNGWNVLPPLRRFANGRVGIYLISGHPRVYDLALTVAGQLDGWTDIRRTGLRTARITYGGGQVHLEHGEDGARLRIDHACDLTGREVRTSATFPLDDLDHFGRALFVFFRGSR